MLLQELLSEAIDSRVKLLDITPSYMGVAAIMPRIIDEFGMNVIGVSKKNSDDLIEGLLAVLTKDAKKVIDLINKGTFDSKYEKPRAKLAPAVYYNSYNNVDLDLAFEHLTMSSKRK